MEIRKTVADFRVKAKDQLARLEGGARVDVLNKRACLVAFDFEAAARLKDWSSFEEILTVSDVKQCEVVKLTGDRNAKPSRIQRFTVY